MKKILVFLIIAVLVLSFVGCSIFQSGSNNNGNNNNSSSQNPSVDTPNGSEVNPNNPTNPDDPIVDPDDPIVDPDDPIVDPDDPIVDPDDPITDPSDYLTPLINGAFFGDEVTKENNSFYKSYSAEEKELYYTLWKEETEVRVKIDITPYELSKINEAYLEYDHSGRNNTLKIDTYRKCNLTFTVNGVDYYYEEVGIRMRGNTSRTDFCNTDGEMYNLVHFRFSLTETFDGEEYKEGGWAHELYHDWTVENDKARKERKDRSFATMEKMYYKWNKNYDQTYIREVYANRLFQQYGILAPHITLCQLSVDEGSGVLSLGVGNLYETIDKQFIKRNFDKENKGGDLYKCTYRADLTSATNYGVETPTQRFAYSLKTNDDRDAPDYNHNKFLKELINVLSMDKNSSAFKEALEGVVDMDYFARFEAVNYLLGNPDCIRNNSNNYYLYFTPSGKAFIIPYDYDRCLGANMDWNPSGDGMISTKPFTISSCCGGVSNPLYTKTILENGLDEYKNLFAEKLVYILSGEYFTYENYRNLYNSYKATYENLTTPTDIDGLKGHIKIDKLKFSEEGTKNFGSNNENMSVSDYMSNKVKNILTDPIIKAIFDLVTK